MSIPVRRFALPVLLLAMACGYYWRLTLTRQFSWLEHPEVAARVLPRLDLQARTLHAHRLPLWDRYLEGGRPLVGDWESGTASPLNWILFAAPLREGHIRLGALQAYWVLLHWLGACLCYALCRELGAGRSGAVFAGAAFGFSGWFGSQWSPTWVSGALTLPAILVSWIRARRTAGIAAAACMGLAVGMAWLSTDFDAAVLATALAAGLWTYGAAAGPAGSAARMSASAVIAFLAGALQMVSATEWPPLHTAFDWRALPGLILPGWSDSFLGITVTVFAVAGAVRLWKCGRPRSRPTAVGYVPCLDTGGAGCEKTLRGPTGAVVQPPQNAAAWVRGAGGVLCPLLTFAAAAGLVLPLHAWMVLAQLSLCTLAGLALEPWLEEPVSRIARRILTLAGIGGFLYYTVLAVLRLEWGSRPLLSALLALLLAALLYARENAGISTHAAAAAAIALALFEAGMVSGPATPEIERDDSRLTLIRKQADLARYLHQQPGWFRVAMDPTAIAYRFGEWYAIEQVANAARSRAPLGVQYVLSRQSPGGDMQDMFAGETGVKVFRDGGAGPPWRTIHDSACAGSDEVQLEGRDDVSLVLVANMRCAGVLVVGDRNAPGWRAWVDRHRIDIVAVDDVRAVRVDAGRHRIEFRYRPIRVYWGAALSLAGFALAGWLVWRDRGAVRWLK